MDERIDAIHSALADMGIGGIKRKNLDKAINHITKAHFDYIKEISKNITKSVDTLAEIMAEMDIRRPGRFITFLAMIANANVAEFEARLLVRKLVENSDPTLIPGVEELIRRVAKIDDSPHGRQCVI